MIAMKGSTGALSRGGLYVVAIDDGQLRALVDEELAMSLPNIQEVIRTVARALDRTLPDGMAVYMRFERGPGCKTKGVFRRALGADCQFGTNGDER